MLQHILCDEIRDFCQIFRHKRTALVAAVAAGAGGAVIVEAERERLIIRQLSALVDDGPHAPADRLVKVCRDGKPGKIVVVEMLDDWPQECVADAKASVRRKIKIGKAPFHRENLTYVVRRTEKKAEQVAHILSKVPGSAIVYVRNRKHAQELAQWINQKFEITNQKYCDFYHAVLNLRITVPCTTGLSKSADLIPARGKSSLQGSTLPTRL